MVRAKVSYQHCEHLGKNPLNHTFLEIMDLFKKCVHEVFRTFCYLCNTNYCFCLLDTIYLRK